MLGITEYKILINNYLPKAKGILAIITEPEVNNCYTTIHINEAISLILVCALLEFSRIILVYYCKCCNLIGYSTCYLFLDR